MVACAEAPRCDHQDIRRPAVDAKTLWPSGLRRWLKAPFRKGVGWNPTGVIQGSVGRVSPSPEREGGGTRTHAKNPQRPAGRRPDRPPTIPPRKKPRGGEVTRPGGRAGHVQV